MTPPTFYFLATVITFDTTCYPTSLLEAVATFYANLRLSLPHPAATATTATPPTAKATSTKPASA